MRLTSPSGAPRRPTSVSTSKRAITTEPGYINPNRQRVIASTGAPSSTRASQTIYHLRCDACHHAYGCNGLDIKARLCPSCQGGVPGEPLREAHPAFDFGPA